jgi:hypothetical protein
MHVVAKDLLARFRLTLFLRFTKATAWFSLRLRRVSAFIVELLFTLYTHDFVHYVDNPET